MQIYIASTKVFTHRHFQPCLSGLPSLGRWPQPPYPHLSFNLNFNLNFNFQIEAGGPWDTGQAPRGSAAAHRYLRQPAATNW